MRYQIGMSKGVSCVLVERNPGLYPIVDMGGPWGFGSVVALVENKEDAEKICSILNRKELSEGAQKLLKIECLADSPYYAGKRLVGFVYDEMDMKYSSTALSFLKEIRRIASCG